jgi:hypothetical protein
MRSSEKIFRKTASSESSNLQSLATVTNVAWDLLDYYWRRSRTFLWKTCLAKCQKISGRINLPKCPQKPTQWRLATKSFPIQTFPNFRTQATGQSFTARHERAPKITELKNRRTCPFAPAKRPTKNLSKRLYSRSRNHLSSNQNTRTQECTSLKVSKTTSSQEPVCTNKTNTQTA